MMYARKTVRKKRELDADIVNMYWMQGMLQSEIAEKIELGKGYIAKVLMDYYDSKTVLEKHSLIDRRTKTRFQLMKGQL